MKSAEKIPIEELVFDTECPVCKSTLIRKDFDYPDTMRCCKDCGADFDITGEIILNPKKL